MPDSYKVIFSEGESREIVWTDQSKNNPISSLEIRERLTDTDQFSIECKPSYKEIIATGDTCRIEINGRPKFLGFVDDKGNSSGSRRLTITGSDSSSVLATSSLPFLFRVGKGQQLLPVFQTLCEDVGLKCSTVDETFRRLSVATDITEDDSEPCGGISVLGQLLFGNAGGSTGATNRTLTGKPKPGTTIELEAALLRAEQTETALEFMRKIMTRVDPSYFLKASQSSLELQIVRANYATSGSLFIPESLSKQLEKPGNVISSNYHYNIPSQRSYYLFWGKGGGGTSENSVNKIFIRHPLIDFGPGVAARVDKERKFKDVKDAKELTPKVPQFLRASHKYPMRRGVFKNDVANTTDGLTNYARRIVGDSLKALASLQIEVAGTNRGDGKGWTVNTGLNIKDAATVIGPELSTQHWWITECTTKINAESSRTILNCSLPYIYSDLFNEE